MSYDKELYFCTLVSSADDLCKQFGLISASNQFETLVKSLKKFLKMLFEKISRRQKSRQNPGRYRLTFGMLKLTLNAPIATKVVCFSCLLKCLRSLYGKQCGHRSDCSYRSSLFWVHAVCFYTQFVSNVRQLFAADDIFRCIFFLAL